MSLVSYLDVFFKRNALPRIKTYAIGRSPLYRVLVSLGIGLIALEMLARCLLLYFPWPMLQVDIQNPTILAAKLRWFDKHKGPKIAVIGDSLVYGETMARHGNKDWETQTITHQISNSLSKMTGRDDILVMNLGMDGLLPVEILQMGQILSVLHPDAIVFNVGLRSFSADFNRIEDMYSRPWIKDVTWQSGTGLSWKTENNYHDPLYNIANRIANFIKRNSVAYQGICIMQAYVFKGTLSNWMSKQKEIINFFFKTGHLPMSGNDQSDFILLLKIKQRYRTISFNTDSVQANALQDILKGAWVCPTIIFYANEDPSKINQVLADNKLQALRETLRQKIFQAKLKNRNLVYIPPLTNLKKSHFLDLIHVNAGGYKIYADAVVEALRGTYSGLDIFLNNIY